MFSTFLFVHFVFSNVNYCTFYYLYNIIILLYIVHRHTKKIYLFVFILFYNNIYFNFQIILQLKMLDQYKYNIIIVIYLK